MVGADVGLNVVGASVGDTVVGASVRFEHPSSWPCSCQNNVSVRSAAVCVHPEEFESIMSPNNEHDNCDVAERLRPVAASTAAAVSATMAVQYLKQYNRSCMVSTT